MMLPDTVPVAGSWPPYMSTCPPAETADAPAKGGSSSLCSPKVCLTRGVLGGVYAVCKLQALRAGCVLC